MSIIFKKTHYRLIVDYSKEVFPKEACGFLIGARKLGNKFVFDVIKAPNILNSSSRYEIDPEFELQVFSDAERKSLDVLGFYHSHPFWSATPSGIDRDLASFKDLSYVIYSISENTLASFTWDGSIFQQEEVIIQ